jgi:DNA-binding CsgD family transcriptional regulator
VNSSLEWRRNKVQELASQGYNQSEITRILQISQPTINRDIIYKLDLLTNATIVDDAIRFVSQ